MALNSIKLTAGDEKCIQEYIKNAGKKTAAYRKAFPRRVKNWAPATVNNKAWQFFNREEIQARLSSISKQVQKATLIDAEYILKRLHSIESFDNKTMYDDDGLLLPVSKWPDGAGQIISGIEVSSTTYGDDKDEVEITTKKVKTESRVKALELMGKHINVKAFDNTLNVTLPVVKKNFKGRNAD